METHEFEVGQWVQGWHYPNTEFDSKPWKIGRIEEGFVYTEEYPMYNTAVENIKPFDPHSYYSVGNIVKITAKRSFDSRTFDGMYRKITRVYNNCVDVEGGSGGLHFDEVEKVVVHNEFKVGDIVVITEDRSGDPVGTITEILSMKVTNYKVKDMSGRSGTNSWSQSEETLRHATAEEIEEYKRSNSVDTSPQFKGDLEGFPEEVVNRMLYYQQEQGNERNVEVFEREKNTSRYSGGFTWGHTEEGHTFWDNVITHRDFKLFFDRYHKTKTKSEEILIKDLPEPYKSIALKEETLLPLKPKEELTLRDFKWGSSPYGVDFWKAVSEGGTPKHYPVKIDTVNQELQAGETGILGWLGVRNKKVMYDSSILSYLQEVGVTEESPEWLNTHTLLSKSLRKRIQATACNEEIKEFLLSMDYAIDKNFCSYNTEDNSITFCPKGKIQHWIGSTWKKEGRQSTTVHKFLNKILKDKYEEYDIKCFADEIQSADQYTVRFVSGYDIPRYYHDIDTDDWATNSCMSGCDTDFFQVYTSPAFELGIIEDGSEIVGRFLRVTDRTGFVFCDRLYYKDETILSFFKSWCVKNNQTRKEHQSYDYKTEFYNNEEGSFTRDVYVDISDTPLNYGYMPYMDTLTYGDLDGTTLSNSYEYGSAGFTNTDGYVDDENYRICYVSDERYPIDDMVVIDFGDAEGEWVHMDYAYYSDRNNGYCLA